MIRLIASLLVLVLGAAAGAGLAACGDEESNVRLLPAKNANEIERNLADVEDLIAECNLTGAEDAVDDVEAQVAKVADRIDPELRANLLEGTALLTEKINAEDCETDTETAPVETTETAPPPDEETTDEEPTTTEKEPTTTDQEPPAEQPPAEEPPAEEPPAEQPPAEQPPSGGGESPVPPPSGGVGPGQSAEGIG